MSFESNRLNELDKNYISNSGFDFFQRLLDKTRTDAFIDYETADRFIRCAKAYEGVASSSQVHKVEDSPANIKTIDCCEINYTAETSGAKTEIVQRIESIFARELANENASFGVWIKQDNLQSIRVKLHSPTTRDDFSSGENTAYIDSTIPLDTSGGWLFIPFEEIAIDGNAKNGLELRIECSNPITLSVAKSFRITGLKLNKGIKARKWSPMDGSYLKDLNICRRYFQVMTCSLGNQVSVTGNNFIGYVFPVEMRTTPDFVGDIDLIQSGINARTLNELDFRKFRYEINSSTTGFTYRIETFHFDAEL